MAAGESVVDVPPTLSARVRVLGSGRSSKNDPNDALSTAIAALRGRRLRSVTRDDHTQILRMLADRHHDLAAAHTQAMCRLHAKLADLIPGGLSGRLTDAAAVTLLRSVDAGDGVVAERKHQASDLLADVRRLDHELAAIKARISIAVQAAHTSLTELHGVGPVVAALVIGHTGDVSRFASKHHYASYNGSAPIEASSGPKRRHRLNTRGNRQLNHALYMIAVTQVGHDTPGRDYYQRKIAEGKTKNEAMRALIRRISDAVYRQRHRRRRVTGPGGQPGTTLTSSVTGSHPDTAGASDQSLPDPTSTLRRRPAAPPRAPKPTKKKSLTQIGFALARHVPSDRRDSVASLGAACRPVDPGIGRAAANAQAAERRAR